MSTETQHPPTPTRPRPRARRRRGGRLYRLSLDQYER